MSIDKKVLKSMGKKIGRAVGVTVAATGGVALRSATFPTTLRGGVERATRTGGVLNYGLIDSLGLLGCWLNGCYLFGDLCLSGPLTNYSKAILITNAASLVYETGRGIVKGLCNWYQYEKRRLSAPSSVSAPTSPTSPPKSSPLETKAETPETKKPVEIINPWNIKIDPLENKLYAREN